MARVVFEVVQDEALEIRHDYVARQFLVGQTIEIIGGLLKGGIEVCARALVLGQ